MTDHADSNRQVSHHHEDVRTFMAASGQTPSRDTAQLYYKLVHEEFRELVAAWEGRDIEETLDAIADSVWVLYGMALAMGACPERVWRPVAQANLAKIDSATGRVLKCADGKVQKPEGWVAPSHEEEASRVMQIIGGAE